MYVGSHMSASDAAPVCLSVCGISGSGSSKQRLEESEGRKGGKRREGNVREVKDVKGREGSK